MATEAARPGRSCVATVITVLIKATSRRGGSLSIRRAQTGRPPSWATCTRSASVYFVSRRRPRGAWRGSILWRCARFRLHRFRGPTHPGHGHGERQQRHGARGNSVSAGRFLPRTSRLPSPLSKYEYSTPRGGPTNLTYFPRPRGRDLAASAALPG